MRMRKAAIALISLFAAVSLNARAGSVAGTGGSTEITQLPVSYTHLTLPTTPYV